MSITITFFKNEKGGSACSWGGRGIQAISASTPASPHPKAGEGSFHGVTVRSRYISAEVGVRLHRGLALPRKCRGSEAGSPIGGGLGCTAVLGTSRPRIPKCFLLAKVSHTGRQLSGAMFKSCLGEPPGQGACNSIKLYSADGCGWSGWGSSLGEGITVESRRVR